jgi:histidinol-phosphatase
MPDSYLAFAAELAVAAGEIIREGFNRASVIAVKADGSPVTDIDVRVNRLVAETIQRRYPGHGVRGEEQDLGTGDETYQWICDPLDGTLPYLNGLPNSMFMLALTRESEVLAAVAYDPFADHMYRAARQGGAFCDGRPIRVARLGLGAGRVVLGTSSAVLIEAVSPMAGHVELVPGTGFKSMMVARGEAIGTVKQTADFHDVAPAALIVTEAGGRVTALDGSRLALDREITLGVIISNHIAHDQLVEAVARWAALRDAVKGGTRYGGI